MSLCQATAWLGNSWQATKILYLRRNLYGGLSARGNLVCGALHASLKDFTADFTALARWARARVQATILRAALFSLFAIVDIDCEEYSHLDR